MNTPRAVLRPSGVRHLAAARVAAVQNDLSRADRVARVANGVGGAALRVHDRAQAPAARAAAPWPGMFQVARRHEVVRRVRRRSAAIELRVGAVFGEYQWFSRSSASRTCRRARPSAGPSGAARRESDALVPGPSLVGEHVHATEAVGRRHDRPRGIGLRGASGTDLAASAALITSFGIGIGIVHVEEAVLVARG